MTASRGREQRIFAARFSRHFVFPRAETTRKREEERAGGRLGRKRRKDDDEEEEIEQRSPWRIDDASKINANTTKLVPAAFARGNGISVFTNSIDDISSSFFPLPFSLSLFVSHVPPFELDKIFWRNTTNENYRFSRFELFLDVVTARQEEWPGIFVFVEETDVHFRERSR